MPGLSVTEQSTKAAKELVQMMKNPGSKNPFTIGESQLHAIDRLATLFNTIQPQQTNKPNSKLVPRELPTVAPPRFLIIVTSPRVHRTVAPPRLIGTREPVLSQEENIEDIIQMDIVESKFFQQQRHWYPTRITQLYQDMNQVKHT